MDFLRRNKNIGLFVLMLGISTIGFLMYNSLYEARMSDYQNAYESLWEDARTGAQQEGVVVEKMEDIRQSIKPQENTSVQQEEVTKWQEMLGLEIEAPDFEVLQSYNEDVIAYMVVPDTPISYPVLRSEDNSYYLKHNIDNTSGYPGCLYVENYNSEQLEEPLTIVYGHNMRNDTMFGTLTEYGDAQYRKEHPYIVLYLPDEVRVYEVVIATKYSDEHLLSYDFIQTLEGEFKFQGFTENESMQLVNRLVGYKAKGAYIDSEKIQSDDRMIVLSTCVDLNKRYLVGAREILIEEE